MTSFVRALVRSSLAARPSTVMPTLTVVAATLGADAAAIGAARLATAAVQ